MIGSVLDRYEILQKIGEGGMATVYRGRHRTLGRIVAIKVLHPHLSASERNRRRFAREARAIEHLDHENILRIFDYSGEDGEDCFIVTEYVDGVTLQELVVERGRLPSEVVCMMGIRLAGALEYAHDMGIIHRDLKPENVMIRRDGTLKLMDFGIARFLDEMQLTLTGALVGSPAYMSPEQAMERVLDPRSDLFSMGTLLFHLVSGQLPFQGSNPSVILRNIIEGKRPDVAELVPDISGTLADLIERLLQTDPEDRPGCAAQVREVLERALYEVGIEPDDASWSPGTWLLDPDAYEERLRTHLIEQLMARGRAALDAQDHLGALRLFNRLLAMDEDNAEVLALVQNMHSSHETRRPRRWWAAGLAVVAGAAVVAWGVWPEGGGAPDSTVQAETPTPAVVSAPAVEASTTSGASASFAQDQEVASGDGRMARPSSAAGLVSSSSQVSSSSRESMRTSVRRSVARVRSEAVAPAGASHIVRRNTPPEASAGGEGMGAPADLPPVEDKPAELYITVVPGHGDIYIDGKLRGSQPGLELPLQVEPGTHTLEVKNRYALPYKRQFTVGAGERKNLPVQLQPAPATIRFGDAYSGDCHVFLDGDDQGTVSLLGRKLELDDDQRRVRHLLRIECPGAVVREVSVGPLQAAAVISP